MKEILKKIVLEPKKYPNETKTLTAFNKQIREQGRIVDKPTDFSKGKKSYDCHIRTEINDYILEAKYTKKNKINLTRCFESHQFEILKKNLKLGGEGLILFYFYDYGAILVSSKELFKFMIKGGVYVEYEIIGNKMKKNLT